jgi:hypothetical protein
MRIKSKYDVDNKNSINLCMYLAAIRFGVAAIEVAALWQR